MNILVLNLSSKFFKYELFDWGLGSLEKGELELFLENGEPVRRSDKGSLGSVGGTDLQEKVDKLFREMLRQIGDVTQIKAVGHRVVHGGDKYLETQKIDTPELYNLEALNDLAPLHNPYNLAGIKASNKYIPDTPDYAVFDTAFFKDLPETSKIYPISYKYYKDGIHKFGFHGIAHKFAGQQAAKKIKTPFDKCNIISVYLDDECSVTAMAKAKPVDTSTGFALLEGLMMQTRSGDVGAGAILEIIKRSRIDNKQEIISELENILNNESGIKGISNKENFEDLLKGVQWGEERSKLAFEMFVYQVKKYIGAYAAVLGEVDAIVFTGKIGAGKTVTRKKICDKIKVLEDVPVISVDAHEELAIAQEVKEKI